MLSNCFKSEQIRKSTFLGQVRLPKQVLWRLIPLLTQTAGKFLDEKKKKKNSYGYEMLKFTLPNILNCPGRKNKFRNNLISWTSSYVFRTVVYLWCLCFWLNVYNMAIECVYAVSSICSFFSHTFSNTYFFVSLIMRDRVPSMCPWTAFNAKARVKEIVLQKSRRRWRRDGKIPTGW